MISDRRVPLATAVALLVATAAAAHDGPPYPIISNQAVGAYILSLWTDPDATDDGTAEGQFWVLLEATGGAELPATTRVRVSVRPLDRDGPQQAGDALPVGGNAGNQHAALLMDHEGRFAVRVDVDGPLGRAEAASEVDATYDLRPPPGLVVVYALPFVALGALWLRVLLGRRRRRRLMRERGAGTTA
jgi:hypothetical protein